MVDFHTHILPQMDDGAKDLETSLRMIKDSYDQGIDVICATPHFIAYEESIESFLKRREASYSSIYKYIQNVPIKIKLGCEILYFPGIAECIDLQKLALEGTNLILVEPPMSKWSNYVISEIETIQSNLGLQPVIAHLDRYMYLFDNDRLIEEIDLNRCKIQFNFSYFIECDINYLSLELLKSDQISFLGSDCHNMETRRQNFSTFEHSMQQNNINIKELAINKF